MDTTEPIPTLYFIDKDGNQHKCHELLPKIRKIMGEIEVMNGELIEVIEDKDAHFKKRNENRVTEPKAEEYLNKKKIRYTRFGLDHLDSSLPITEIPPLIRAIPDFIVWNKKDKALFFEAKGFNYIAKIKKEDMKHYEIWNKKMEIIFFLYDCIKHTYCIIKFNALKQLIEKKKPSIGHYPESKKSDGTYTGKKAYYKIDVKWLPEFYDL